MRPNYPIRRQPAMSAGTQRGATTSGRFALVVSRSPVNSVVVSRVIQDCGIRSVTANPDNAIEILQASLPVFIVAEACREPAALAPLLGHTSSISDAPPIICLVNDSNVELPDYNFKAIVKMPITIEAFRPMIEDCL